MFSEVREAIEEFAAEQIEITIVIKVNKIRRRTTEYFEYLACRCQLDGFGVARRGRCAFVFQHQDKTVERTVRPCAVAIPCVIPSIVAPVLNSDD